MFIVYMFNFSMTADHMFVQPENIVFKSKAENTLTDSSVVVAVQYNGQAKAYPIRSIIYHHQVRDTIGGKPVMVQYCSVCRTGRVFEPTVDGKPETFRLVGSGSLQRNVRRQDNRQLVATSKRRSNHRRVEGIYAARS
ncbi:MAG: DUF3179 domain-containing (seleno)protein [Bacteroidota bacterium]